MKTAYIVVAIVIIVAVIGLAAYSFYGTGGDNVAGAAIWDRGYCECSAGDQDCVNMKTGGGCNNKNNCETSCDGTWHRELAV